MTTKYYSPDQFRQFFNNPPLGRDRCYRDIRSGKIKSVRDGQKILIPESEITGYLQRRLEAVGAS